MGTVNLWSTGVDANKNILTHPVPDPHWWIVRGPKITQPQQAVVLGDQRVGTYYQTSTSRWIGVDANGTGDPSDYYVYQMRFALELDFTKVWVRITGEWSVDNYGEIRLDGHPLPAGSGGGETSLAAGGGIQNYDWDHAFSVTQKHTPPIPAQSHLDLKAGWHGLDFWVHNEGAAGKNNPCGLNVYRMALEINPVHEFPTATGAALYPKA